MKSSADRQESYRRNRHKARLNGPTIACECGCETLIPAITASGKKARFAQGHNWRNKPRPKGRVPWNKGQKAKHPSPKQGTTLSAEEIARRTETRRAKYGGHYVSETKRQQRPRTAEERERISKAVKTRDLTGPNNPFWGKRHSADSRQKMSDKISKERHPQWNGGTGTLPYGPEFTKKFKRLIRARDNYTCQRCGKTRADQNNRVLEIHHIDHDKFNNDPSNLVTVCSSCNVWLSWHRDEPFTRI